MQVPKVNICETCPLKECPGRVVGRGDSDRPGAIDIIVLGGAPREETESEDFLAFKDRGGKFFSKIFSQMRIETPSFSNVTPYYLHAVQCITEKEDIEVIKHCSPIAHQQILSTGCNVILALGVTALKSLGIPMSMKDARGREFNINLEGRQFKVLATFAPGFLLKKENAGKIKIFKGDLKKALEMGLKVDREKIPIPELTKNFRLCKTVEEARAAINEALMARTSDGKLPLISVDTETTGLDTHSKDFRMIAGSFGWAEDRAAAFLFNHKDMKEDWRGLIDDIRRLLSSENPKAFHHYKFDYKVLSLAQDFEIKNVQWDTMYGEYLLDEAAQGTYGLKDIVRRRLPDFTDYEKKIKEQFNRDSTEKGMVDIEKHLLALKGMEEEAKARKTLAAMEDGEVGKAKKKEANEVLKKIRAEIKALKEKTKGLKEQAKAEKSANEASFENLDVEDLLLYAAIDANCTWRIAKQQVADFKKEIKSPEEASDLFITMKNAMLPVTPVIAVMEHEGIKIDLEYLSYLEREFQKIIEEEQQRIFEVVNHEFNLESNQQLESVLINDRGIKLEKRTKKDTGFCLDEGVLEELGKTDELCQKIIKYRKAYKAKNTFCKGIRELSISDGRIHGNLHQTGTSSGRLSGSSPNLQNLPSKILNLSIKKLFISDSEDEDFVNLDYSGAELRVLCAYARDENLISTLNSGMNMHSFVASQIFGDSYEEIQGRKKYKDSDPKKFEELDGKRQIAKMAVFLTIYGGSAQTLFENLINEGKPKPMEECEQIISTFLSRFPVITQYMNSIKATVEKKGYVRSYFGRRRRFPLAAVDWTFRNSAFREGINFPIQGTSSDLVLSQLTEMYHAGKNLGFKPRLTVHDSIAFCWPKSRRDECLEFMNKYAEKRVQEKFPWMPVAFEYEAAYGPSYGECTEMIKG